MTASGIVDDGNGGANYSYTFVTAAGTINQLAITVTAATDTKTYDGTTTSAATPIVTPGLGAGDTADFTQVFDSRNAGSQTLTASGIVDDGNGGANYSYTFVTAAGTINQLAITVTAATDTKTYDGTTTSAATPIVTPGLGDGDTADFTQVFDSRNAGSQTLTASGIVDDGNGGANYSYTFVTAAGTINQLAITVTAATDTKTYDGTTASSGVPTITAGSLATGDTTTSFTQVFDSRNAGPESLVPSGIVDDGNGGANYSYTFVAAAGTINQLAITVTAATDTKTYDGTTASSGVPTITAGSLATGDTTTSFTQVFDSRNAGPEPLTPAESSTTATAAPTTPTPSSRPQEPSTSLPSPSPPQPTPRPMTAPPPPLPPPSSPRAWRRRYRRLHPSLRQPKRGISNFDRQRNRRRRQRRRQLLLHLCHGRRNHQPACHHRHRRNRHQDL